MRVLAKGKPVRAGTGGEAKPMVAEEDQGLLSALKALRLQLARAQSVPAYVVFTDRTLIEMAEKRPATLDALASVGGVGAKKRETYGRAFLEVIRGAPAPEVHPARRALAGRDEGDLFDRLAEAAQALSYGEDGAGKFMALTQSHLRHLAERRPRDLGGVARIVGEPKAERFGPAFLTILRDA